MLATRVSAARVSHRCQRSPAHRTLTLTLASPATPTQAMQDSISHVPNRLGRTPLHTCADPPYSKLHKEHQEVISCLVDEFGVDSRLNDMCVSSVTLTPHNGFNPQHLTCDGVYVCTPPPP